MKYSLIELDLEATKFDLLMNMQDTGGDLSGEMVYSTDLFDESRISRMLSQFEAVLWHVVTQPDLQLEALDQKLDEARRKQRAVDHRKRRKANLGKLKGVRRRVVDLSNYREEEGP